MSQGVYPRFPREILEGNGISVTYVNGVPQVATDLDTLNVTPAGAAAPVPLAQTLATLLANAQAQQYVTVIDDGFYDQPGTGNSITTDDGWF